MTDVVLAEGGDEFHLAAVVLLDGLGAGGELRHGRTERAEVVHHRLVDEDVAVGEIEDPLLHPGFPQAPDDLEGGVGLAGAGGHDQEVAVLALGDGFDGRVDGALLVVAGLLVGGVGVVVLQDDAFFLGVEALEGAVLLPELGGGWELVEGEGLLDVAFAWLQGLVVEDEAVAVGGEDERDAEGG